MMYDIEIFLSIRFRTPTSKREVGVFKNLHICVFGLQTPIYVRP